MSFNINKSAKFNLTIQPSNSTGATQTSIDNSLVVSPTAFNANEALSKIINDLAFKQNLTDEAEAALNNRFVSKAFDDLYKRGVNPLRPEILLVNEYSPLATGEEENNADAASINLNYGEGTNLKVNQVMRLIDLQRVIRKHILKVAGDFLEEYVDASEEVQSKIISYMHRTLVNNISDFLVLGSDVEAMVDLLIELVSDPAKGKNSDLSNFTIGQSAAIRLAKAGNSSKLQKKASHETAREASARASGYGNRTVTGTHGGLAMPVTFIKQLNAGNRSGFLRSLARYVLLDYITQNSIAFITRIYDLKDLLKESISIAYTELPPAENHSVSSQQAAIVGIPFAGKISASAGSLVATVGLTTLNSSTLASVAASVGSGDDMTRKSSAKDLLARRGMLSSGGSDSFSSLNKHDLSRVIDAKSQTGTAGDVPPIQENNEERFGSNRHMYLNLFSNLLRSMTFMQSREEDSSTSGAQPKPINKTSVAFTAGTKNLAKGLQRLRNITPKSMVSSKVHAISDGNMLDGSKLNAILSSVSDDKDEALAQLVMAVCYDQVAGANIYGSGNKLIAPKTFEDFGQIGESDSVLLSFFNNTFFNTGITNWDTLADPDLTNFAYSDYARDEKKLGVFLKDRFEPRDDKGTLFVPNEHTYEDNDHRKDSFVVASDYYFNKAMATEELNFDEMTQEANQIVDQIGVISHDIIAMLGLDFDDDGNSEYSDSASGGLNGFSEDSSPITYFYSMCDLLGDKARAISNDLVSNCDMAVPLIEAGKMNDMSFTADVIRASFLTNVSNTSNKAMLLNIEKDGNGKFYDENLVPGLVEDQTFGGEGTAAEAAAIFQAEATYHVEEKVWYKLFSQTLKHLLKGKDVDNLNFEDEESYPLDSSKTYKSIIFNDASRIGDWNETKEKDENGDSFYSWEGKNFGARGFKFDGHPDDYEGIFGDDDEHFSESLNIPDDMDLWAKIAIAMVKGALITAGIIGASILIAVGGPAAAIFGSIASFFVFPTMGAIGVGTLCAAAIGGLHFWAQHDTDVPEPDGRPQGVGFGKSGVFEMSLLKNVHIIPPSLRVIDAASILDGDIFKVASSGFGLYPRDNYLLRARPNGHVKQWGSLKGLVDLWLDFWNSTSETIMEFFGGEDLDTQTLVPDEDIYKPYHFTWNQQAGEYGGIFKVNTAARYTLFTLFFARILYKGTAIRYSAAGKKLYVKYFAVHWKAVSDALLRNGKDPDFSSTGTYSNLETYYDNAYSETKSSMDRVVQLMKDRRREILRNLAYLSQNADEIKEAVNRSESILRGQSSEIPVGEKIALAYLKEVGFAKSGFVFLNDNTAGHLLQNYQKNYLLDFRSDEDESANPEGISTYPFFKKESYDIRDLKIMARLFSEKNRGYTSSVDDDLGRKSIMHIGVPIGLLSALQNEAYQKTGEIEFYYSNNIAIHITKKNDLNPAVKYMSRTYVFNMSKYVTPFKTSEDYRKIYKPGRFNLGNHLENYDDTWGIEDLKDNMEILTVTRKNPLYEIGIEGIKLIEKQGDNSTENIYSSDVYESMLENHLYDYYSKLYTEATTGINISETLFPLDREKTFDGDIDGPSESDYEALIDELTNRYPASNIIPSVAQEFYRVFKIIRSSIYFSSESRFESCVATQCFQRIFSIPISERDFLLKSTDYNIDSDDLYKPDKMPKMILTSQKTGLSQDSISKKTGISEARSNPNTPIPVFNITDGAQILEFEKGLNPNKTDVGTFTVEIALLKSSKLG